MFTRRKRFAISLILAVLLTAPPVTLAQVATAAVNDWAGLKTVTAGSRLDVKLKNGKRVKGKLISVSDAALSLSDHNKPRDLNRDDVLVVDEVRGRSAKKATLIGAGVGVAAGAGLGAGVSGTKCDPPGTFLGGCFNERPLVTAVGAVVGIVVGAITGFVVGKTRHKRTIVYQAKHP